ncbi:MAG: hypothetical protein KA187_05085 [Arenimonas sp.]|nr:hypothetical protein [Arenimonas sp.]MBP6626770.1 hypothetical protein [Arenimonas sp.]
MTISRSLPLALLIALSGAACASSPPAAVAQAPQAAEEPPMICQADKGQWALGQTADDTVVARIVAETTSERVRVIRPGMAVTMDFREDRVNVDVDAENRILSVRCG